MHGRMDDEESTNDAEKKKEKSSRKGVGRGEWGKCCSSIYLNLIGLLHHCVMLIGLQEQSEKGVQHPSVVLLPT